MKLLFLLLLSLACAGATISSYCPCPACCSAQNGVTALGTVPKVGRTVAGPRSVPLGAWVEIRIPGRAPIRVRVEDRTAKRFDGRWDLFTGSHQEALRFGKRNGTVKILGKQWTSIGASRRQRSWPGSEKVPALRSVASRLARRLIKLGNPFTGAACARAGTGAGPHSRSGRLSRARSSRDLALREPEAHDMNYYNENDPGAAAWLKELIQDGTLSEGFVDSRSIVEVQPTDLAGFEQCHFFAGIGGWSLALQLAGWSGPVWSASLPCPPFSTAGRQKGTEDERHLWPEFLRLVAECRPRHCFGEQVASKLGREWLTGVRADLEGVGYAVGAADLCAPGVGAPHLRQRLYWVADREQQGLEGHARDGNHGHEPGRERADAVGPAPAGGGVGWLEHPESDRRIERGSEPGGRSLASGRGTGHWSNAVWLPCRDGKNRRAEPGIFPLVDGVPRSLGPRRFEGLPVNATPEARKMRLKGYGNAIIPQLAAEFVKAFAETRQ